MAEEGTKITIRMGAADIQRMEDYMADREIGNRSDFIRDAIAGYIEAQNSGVSGTGTEGGIFVRLSDVQLGILKGIEEDGTCSVSAEEFARKCILDVIVPADVRQDVVARAVKAAQTAARLK